MTNNLSPEEQAHVNEVLKRMRSKDRRYFAAKDVKRFRQAITDELGDRGELKKDAVDRLLIRQRTLALNGKMGKPAGYPNAPV